MKPKEGSQNLEKFIFKKTLSIILAVGIFVLVFVISTSSVVAYRMTGRVSDAVEDLVKSNITVYLRALEGYEKSMEEDIRKTLEKIPELYKKGNLTSVMDELEKTNISLNGQKALGYDIVIFDMNGKLILSSSPYEFKPDEITLSALRKLKPGEIIFEKMEDVMKYNGKDVLVKEGYVKIDEEKAAVLRAFIDWPGINSLIKSISSIPKKYDFVSKVGVYDYYFEPLGYAFPRLTPKERSMIEKSLKTGKPVVDRKFAKMTFADVIELPPEEGTFSKPFFTLIKTDFDFASSALWALSVFLSLSIIFAVYYSSSLVKKIAHKMNSDIEDLIRVIRKFRDDKIFLPSNKVESSDIKEFKELFYHFYEMAQDITAYVEMLESSEQELEKAYQEVEKAYSELEESHLLFAQELSMIAEGYDEITGNHIYRVGELSAFIAEKLGLGETFVNEIRYYARLHDIGKLLVPHEILNKPGKLTEEEFEVMKKHTLYGEVLLGDLKRFEMAKNIALYHHEKYSGKGYPFGLKGEEIPIEARIVAVVDVYDALRSKRPYKEGMEHERAMKIILEGDGRTSPEDFDPDILEILRRYSSQIEKLWEEVNRIETGLTKKLREIKDIMEN